MAKRFWCRICDRWFDSTEVENAVDLGGGYGRSLYRLYRFPDGSVHDLRAKVVPDPEPTPPATTPPTVEPQLDSTRESQEAVTPVVGSSDCPLAPASARPKVKEPPIVGEGVTAMRAAFDKLFRNQEENKYVDGDSIEKL